MKMQPWVWVGLAIVCVVSCCSFSEADQNLPSQRTLQAMGLSGLEVMSDEEALEVRGMGYGESVAVASGVSWASISSQGGSAGSKNDYFAKGLREARGKTFSRARVKIVYGGRDGHKKKVSNHGGTYGKGTENGTDASVWSNNRNGKYGGKKHRGSYGNGDTGSWNGDSYSKRGKSGRWNGNSGGWSGDTGGKHGGHKGGHARVIKVSAGGYSRASI